MNDEEFRQQGWLQSNQAAIDTGVKAVSSLFLLNGAAATALLAQSALGLKWAALAFAFGSLLAILTMGFAYFFSILLCQTFTPGPPGGDRDTPYIVTGLPNWPILRRWPVISNNGMGKARLFMTAMAMGSIALFLIGCLLVACGWNTSP